MGGKIDTDPASEPLAQEVVKALSFYTRAQDGRNQQWSGSVWLSTPSGPDADGTHEEWFKLAVSKFHSTEIEEVFPPTIPQNGTGTQWTNFRTLN